jgi:UDP-glucose 4-epimerase
MHFAALIEAGESMKQPEIYFRNNTSATLSLLEAMLATGHDRLVFSPRLPATASLETTPILKTRTAAHELPTGKASCSSNRCFAG